MHICLIGRNLMLLAAAWPSVAGSIELEKNVAVRGRQESSHLPESRHLRS